MTDIPERLRALLAEREEARMAKDYARADVLRAAIEAEGFAIKDSPDGATLSELPKFTSVEAAFITDALAETATCQISFHLLFEGFTSDVERFLKGFEAHNDVTNVEVVLVDNASNDGTWMEDVARTHPYVRPLHLMRESGWAEARNAGIKTSRGEVIALVDLSIEPAGDIVTPLIAAFEEPSVGAAGPFGLISHAMREWTPTEGPEVEALEGYALAVRRTAFAKGLIHEKFRWYRNADIDLTFQIRALGYRAVVVPLPVIKHVHRGWEALDEPERAKRSKRNHYIFFDRWKDREDLLFRH